MLGMKPPRKTEEAKAVGCDSGEVEEKVYDKVTEDDTVGEVYDSMDPEATMVKILTSPQRPSQKEMEEHYASHLPNRNWCPICAKSRG